MHIGREGGVDNRWGHGFFPQTVCVLQDPRQVMLELQGRDQPLGQEVERFGSDNVHRVHGRSTLLQQPEDIPALLPLDPFEFQDRRAGSDLFPRRPAQFILESGMAGKDDSKLGQHILAISGEIRRPGLEGG